MAQDHGSIARNLALSGALLVSVGLFTGFWAAAVLTGGVYVRLPRLALSAHLNALLGGFWLICTAFSLEFLTYDAVQKRRLGWLVAIPSWSNWFVTLLASVLGVTGLTYDENPTNNVIAALLQLLVVLPSIAAAIYWIRGFGYFGRRR